MGGIGSGRTRSNPLSSSFCQLDVRHLQRLGNLDPGSVSRCEWTKDGTVLAQALLSAGSSGLTIRYEPAMTGRSTASCTLHAGIDRTPCRFGGSRPWFRCPECRRRVAILYGDSRLACRHCRRPTYPVQRLAPMGRSLARAQRLRVQLGGSVDLTLPFPPRPKGMHSFTYTTLAIRAMAAEAQFNAALGHWVDKVRAGR